MVIALGMNAPERMNRDTGTGERIADGGTFLTL
jgi:hypothetical protein